MHPALEDQVGNPSASPELASRRYRLLLVALCFLMPGVVTIAVYTAKRLDYSVRSGMWVSQLNAPEYPVRWNLEEHRRDGDGFYRIAGWVYQPHGPRWLNTKVVLLKRSQAAPVSASASGLILRTNLQARHDVTVAASDGVDYDRSGFFAVVPQSLVSEGRFVRVMLLVEKDGKQSLIDTGVALDGAVR
jgi:hypothetical protein